MDFQEQRMGAVVVLKPVGPVTYEEAEQVRARLQNLLQSSMGRCVLDTSAIPYVDSSGLETLVDLCEELADGGQSLRLCHVNETLREVLDITGVVSAFEVYEDVNTAVRSFL